MKPCLKNTHRLGIVWIVDRDAYQLQAAELLQHGIRGTVRHCRDDWGSLNQAKTHDSYTGVVDVEIYPVPCEVLNEFAKIVTVTHVIDRASTRARKAVMVYLVPCARFVVYPAPTPCTCRITVARVSCKL